MCSSRPHVAHRTINHALTSHVQDYTSTQSIIAFEKKIIASNEKA